MKKFLIVILIIYSTFVTRPLISNAVTDWNFFAKEVIADIIARGIIRGVVTSMSQSITNAILEGDTTQGGAPRPAYVQNWRRYLGEGQFRGENLFRAQLSQTSNCSYLQESLEQIFGTGDLPGDVRLSSFVFTKGAIPRIHPYELTNKCTLATIEGFDEDEGRGSKDDQDKFISNFINSKDGWGSYQELIEPQNNFFGSYQLSHFEFVAQSETEKEVNEKEAPGGIKSIKRFADEDDSLFNDDSKGCFQDFQGRCVILGDTITPSKIVGVLAAKIFETEFELVSSADDIEDLIVVITAGLVTKFLDFSAGSSIEEGAQRSTVDLRDFRELRACMRECDEISSLSQSECLIALPGLIKAINNIDVGSSSNGGGGNGNGGTQLSIFGGINLQVNGNGNGDGNGGFGPEDGRLLCEIDDPMLRYAKCQQKCIDKLQGVELNPGDDENFCPEGTVKIPPSARNGSEFNDDAPIEASGTIFLNCGKGTRSQPGIIGIWKPPLKCADVGITNPVFEIPDGIPRRATNISTYCLGSRDAPFDIGILNPLVTHQCNGDPEDGISVTLPPGEWWHGAHGPGGADSTVCQ